MKILRINDINGNMRGGMSHYINEVNFYLEKQGHKVESIFQDDIPGGKNPRLRKFLAPFRLPGIIQNKNHDKKTDVVEIHEPLGAWYVRARKNNPGLPPVVISVYGLEARAFESRLLVEKWIGKPMSFISKIGAKSMVAQANYALKHADHVIVETTEDKEWIIKNLGRKSDSITIQTGGVNEVFFSQEQTFNSNIIFMGTWIERKGITLFSKVVSKIVDRYPNIKVSIVGCGCPEKNVYQYFPVSIHRNILVLPKIFSELEAVRLLSNSGIFFFPSNFEGIPLTLLEAAAAGCAILTTKICGMKDVISDGVDGILCKPCDESSFFSKLEGLVEDPGLRQKLGSKARIRAQNYTWQKSADLFLKGCQEAISGQRVS